MFNFALKIKHKNYYLFYNAYSINLVIKLGSQVDIGFS